MAVFTLVICGPLLALETQAALRSRSRDPHQEKSFCRQLQSPDFAFGCSLQQYFWSHPDTALAQLLFNPLNQVTLNIGGPGQTATAPTITVTSTGTAVTSLAVSNVVTNDGSTWHKVPVRSGA